MRGRNITVDFLLKLIVVVAIFFTLKVTFAGTRGPYLILAFAMNYLVTCELGKTFLWGIKRMEVKIVLGLEMTVNFVSNIVVIMLLLFLHLIVHELFESLALDFVVTLWKHLLKVVKHPRQFDCFKKCTIVD